MVKTWRQYFCDYCGEEITDDVHTIQRGRIGYEGENLLESDPTMIRHYHDYCLEFLLCRTASSDAEKKQEPKAVTTEPKPAPEKPKKSPKKGYKLHTDDYLGPFKKGEKDLPGLQALLDTGKTQQWCADEMGVVPSTITSWKREIEQMKKEGTWEAYCEERRNN